MAWYDDYNKRAQSQVLGGQTQDWGVFSAPRTTATAPTASKGSGNLATSLIPTAGGIGGSLAGGAAGAAIGSVVPVVGTAIGGLLGAILGGAGGSALGKVGENAIEGNDDLGEGVLQEALFGGATSLPIGAGFKLARAGSKAATGVGKTAARDLVEQAGRETIGKTAANRLGLNAQPSQAAQTATDDLFKTTTSGRLKTLGDKSLLSQYGTISKPFARSSNPAQTVSTLADAGITKPTDAERIASMITGSNGALTKATSKAVAEAGGVDTSTLRRVFDDALDNYGLVDKDRQSLQKVFDAQMNKLAGGAKGSLSPTSNPTDALEMMKALEKRIANLRGKGDNYRLSTPERMDQASVLQLVHDELEDALYAGAGANANLGKVLTPELRDTLIKQMPNNAQWARYVDDKIMGAKSVADLRSAAAPFVRIGKIIDEGESNAITAGGRLGNAFQGGTLRGAIGEAMTNVLKNPAANAAGNTLRAASGITGRTGTRTAGQGIAPLAARQGLSRAVLNPDQSTQPTGLESALAQELPAAAPIEGAATANPTGYSSAQLGQALMAAYAAGDKASAQVLQQMYELASTFESQGASELSSNARTLLATSGNAINTLDQLESLYGGAGGGSGKLGGSIANLTAGLGLNGGVQTYNDLAASSVSQLAKAINGGGQVSDADAAVIVRALPQVTDTPEVARAKFEALRQRLQTAQQNTLAFGAGGGDLASVLAASGY